MGRTHVMIISASQKDVRLNWIAMDTSNFATLFMDQNCITTPVVGSHVDPIYATGGYIYLLS
jgi:hypothetical protein